MTWKTSLEAPRLKAEGKSRMFHGRPNSPWDWITPVVARSSFLFFWERTILHVWRNGAVRFNLHRRASCLCVRAFFPPLMKKFECIWEWMTRKETCQVLKFSSYKKDVTDWSRVWLIERSFDTRLIDELLIDVKSPIFAIQNRQLRTKRWPGNVKTRRRIVVVIHPGEQTLLWFVDEHDNVISNGFTASRSVIGQTLKKRKLVQTVSREIYYYMTFICHKSAWTPSPSDLS
jgi:hypothetical protein